MSRTVAVSLKMYFGLAQTRQYVSAVGALLREHAAVRSGQLEVIIFPSFIALTEAVAQIVPAGGAVGAQDLFWEPDGAFTGEVSAGEIVEAGATFVEIGHAERRRLFGETDGIVALKTSAALAAGLTPLLCVGETERSGTASAIATVIAQVSGALSGAAPGRIVVAYEPVWAIGAEHPAAVDHVVAVCGALREHLAAEGRAATVIYGGSAGPGLLTALGSSVDGLFLGRFAHDPHALAEVLEEAAP